MQKKEKNIIIVLLLIISTTIGIFYVGSNFKLKNESFKQLPKPELGEDVFELDKQDLPKKIILPVNNSDFEEQQKNRVSIFVLGQKYNSFIREGDTVYQAMENLTKNHNSNFSFSFEEYPSLGIFINEINGLKDGGGKYWIYSVNGKEATIGISKYKLKIGDIISWKLK